MWDVKLLINGTMRHFQFCFTLTMWDVKQTMIKKVAEAGAFYLNYVGCKAKYFLSSHQAAAWFYLNYVGCKVFNTSLITSISYCFTLTMWDVKQI